MDTETATSTLKTPTEHTFRLLEQALPVWDDSILSVEPSPNPLHELNIYQLGEILQDSIDTLPNQGITHIHDGIKAIHLDANAGLLRYVSRERAWNCERDADSEPPALKDMPQFIYKLACILGLNSKELEIAPARWQMAAGSTLKASQPKVSFKMYALAFAQRIVQGLPVQQCGISLAINHKNQIQRLSLEWPEFKLGEHLELQSRQDIIARVTRQIDQHSPTGRLEINAHLAYTRLNGAQHYRPVVTVSINDLPKPYELMVPIA